MQSLSRKFMVRWKGVPKTVHLGPPCQLRSVRRNPVSGICLWAIRSLASHLRRCSCPASFVLAFFLLVELCFTVFYFASGGGGNIRMVGAGLAKVPP